MRRKRVWKDEVHFKRFMRKIDTWAAWAATKSSDCDRRVHWFYFKLFVCFPRAKACTTQAEVPEDHHT